MNPERTREIEPFLDALIQKTMHDRIEWTQKSDSVFSYEKEEYDSVIKATLQKTVLPRTLRTLDNESVRFLFNLLLSDRLRSASAEVVLKIDTLEEQEFAPALARLFNLIEFRNMRKGLETFRRLLE